MTVTLKLSDDWDIQLDGFGDFLTCSGKEQIAQDVASSVRVFRGEDCWDIQRGIPFKSEIFGSEPSQPLLEAYMKQEAIRIDGVADCKLLMSTNNRNASVELLIQTEDGELLNVL